MAKKFLDILGDAFEDETLEEVIPQQRKKRAPKRRKKRFVDVLGENIPEEESTLTDKRTSTNRKKSLLDTMEEALDNQVFDELFPVARKRRPQRRRTSTSSPPANLESRFSTMITTEVLQRAREIAEAKGIRVKDVINAALKLYVEQEVE